MSDSRVARLRQPRTEIDYPTLIESVLDKGLDPLIFQSIVQMHNDQEDRRDQAALSAAVASVSAEVQPVLRDAQNLHLRNRYASHNAMMAMLQPLLFKYSVRVGFDIGALPGEAPVEPDHIRVRIVIGYGPCVDKASYIDAKITSVGSQGGRTQMTPNQALAAATTYAQRTLVRLKFNISTFEEDDDDEGSRSRETQGSHRAEEKADAATADMVGKSAPVDHEAYKQAFRRGLHIRNSEAEIEALLAIPDLKAWLDAAPLRIKADVEAMIAAKREIIAKAAAEAEEKAATTYTPTETLTKLLARVASCETQVALNSFADAPETKDEAAKLSFVESDILMEAVSARLAVLKKEGK